MKSPQVAVLIMTAFLMLFHYPVFAADGQRTFQFSDVDLSGVPDGEHYGTAEDYGGEKIKVKVAVKGENITDIQVVESREDGYVFIASGIIPLIIELQTLDVDAVTGATQTSTAIVSAVKDAILEAKEQ